MFNNIQITGSLNDFAIQQAIIFIQIIIVSIITYFCHRGNIDYNFTPLNSLKKAWFFNLIYLFFSSFFDRFSGVLYFMGLCIELSPKAIKLSVVIIGLFDLISLYFFYATARNSLENSPKTYIKVFISKIIPKANDVHSRKILFIAEVFLLFLWFVIDNNNLLLLYYILHWYIAFISLFLAYVYFSYLDKRINRWYLRMGGGIYFSIQFLNILTSVFPIYSNYITNAGFFLGLVAKVFILIGIYSFILKSVNLVIKNDTLKEFDKIKNKEIKLIYNFYDRIMHEITKGVEATINKSELLLEDKKNFSSRIQKIIEDINHSGYYMDAILTSSNKLIEEKNYESDFSYSENIEEENLKIHSVNTIIQAAWMQLLNKKRKQPKINFYYSGNCFVNCVFEDLLRVFLNIIKNSIESFEGIKDFEHDYKKNITIRTYNKVNSYNEPIVSISIEDNGIGISENIKDKLFEEGFSTKSSERLGRGHGLFMCKEIIKKYNGSINFSSPNPNHSKSLYNGTIFEIILPRHLLK